MQPFILLSLPRSGTTVLSQPLADHPELLYYGELFEPNPQLRQREASRQTVGHTVVRNLPFGVEACRDDEDGAEYLRRFFSRSTQAVR